MLTILRVVVSRIRSSSQSSFIRMVETFTACFEAGVYTVSGKVTDDKENG
jgi:hypothetical protein